MLMIGERGRLSDEAARERAGRPGRSRVASASAAAADRLPARGKRSARLVRLAALALVGAWLLAGCQIVEEEPDRRPGPAASPTGSRSDGPVELGTSTAPALPTTTPAGATPVAPTDRATPTASPVAAFTVPARSIEVTVGQRFAIHLRAIPGAGYRWIVEQEPNRDVVRPDGTERRTPYRPPGSPPPVGEPAEDYWYFEAVAPGTTAISLRHRPPSASPTNPGELVTFVITVRPAR